MWCGQGPQHSDESQSSEPSSGAVPKPPAPRMGGSRPDALGPTWAAGPGLLTRPQTPPGPAPWGALQGPHREGAAGRPPAAPMAAAQRRWGPGAEPEA